MAIIAWYVLYCGNYHSTLSLSAVGRHRWKTVFPLRLSETRLSVPEPAGKVHRLNHRWQLTPRRVPRTKLSPIWQSAPWAEEEQCDSWSHMSRLHGCWRCAASAPPPPPLRGSLDQVHLGPGQLKIDWAKLAIDQTWAKALLTIRDLWKFVDENLFPGEELKQFKQKRWC